MSTPTQVQSAPTRTIADVLREPSTTRDGLAALAKDVERWSDDVAGQPLPTFVEAAVLATAVTQVPYVSLAVIAHHQCLTALQEELNSSGCIESPVPALCNQLAWMLLEAGLHRAKGRWCAGPRPGQDNDLIWDWSDELHLGTGVPGVASEPAATVAAPA